MSLLKPKNVELWYWGYLFQGAIILGIAPILIPLIIAGSRGPAEVGLIVAAFYLGQLLAPLFGILADKTRQFHAIYLGGYVLLAISCVLFPFTANLAIWFLLALLQGIGAAASNTISAMYVVEFHPKSEWDSRIGWLQTFYGTGQALGLFAAALLQKDTTWGMIIAGLLMIPGFILGRRRLPAILKAKRPVAKHIPHHLHRRGFGLHSALHLYQRFNLAHIKQMLKATKSMFALYQLSWFLITLGMWMFMNLYPLLMQKSYGINAGLSSLYYAIFATIGAFVYEPSGKLGEKIGDAKVVLIGALMLFISLLGLSIATGVSRPVDSWFVPLSFAMIPIAWSPLIVAGTALTSDLTNIGQGPGMGIYNANTALASVVGALLAGKIADLINYPAVVVTATLIVFIGLILFIPILKRYKGVLATA